MIDMPKRAQAHNMIQEERRRQIEEEGWTADHDDQHSKRELASAARLYYLHAVHPDALAVLETLDGAPATWPWAAHWWRPTTPIRDLVKAGALIDAEMDRLQRRREDTPGLDTLLRWRILDALEKLL